MPEIGDIVRASDLAKILDSISTSSTGIIGEIIGFPGNSAPKGTLICDGSEISREAYSELFAVIGTNNGEGDGTTTFNIPDLRDKWIKYYGTENSVGEVLAEGLPNITGLLSAIYSATRGQYSGALSMVAQSSGAPSTTSGAGSVGINFDASVSNAIYGSSTHVTPNSIVLLPCIRYE